MGVGVAHNSLDARAAVGIGLTGDLAILRLSGESGHYGGDEDCGDSMHARSYTGQRSRHQTRTPADLLFVNVELGMRLR